MIWLWILIFAGEQGTDALKLGAMFKARYALARGEHGRALQLLEPAFAVDDRDPEVAWLKLEILTDMSTATPLAAIRQQQDLLRALVQFERRFPNDYRFAKALGTFLVRERLTLDEELLDSPITYLTKAVELLQAQKNRDKELSDASYYAGLWYLRNNHFLKAADAFVAVSRLEPEASWAWYYAARALEGSHQLRKALVFYERYLQVAARDPIEYEIPIPFTVHLLRHLLKPDPSTERALLDYLASGDNPGERAVQAATRLLEVARSDQALRVLLAVDEADRSADHYRLLALCRMHLHQYETLYEEIMGVVAHLPEQRDELVDDAMEAALSAGRFAEVVRLRLIFPDTPGHNLKLDLYASFAQVLAEEDDTLWQAALARHKKAGLIHHLQGQVAQHSLRVVALRNLVQLYMGWEDWRGALATLEKLHSLRPAEADESDDLAVLYYLSGEKDKSFQLYERLVDNHPERMDIRNNFAYFLAESGRDPARAHALLEPVPLETNGAYLDTMGYILFKMGALQEAESYLKRALAMEADDPEKLEHLGDLYHAMGRADEARTAWMRAMEGARKRYLPLLDKLDPAS